MRFDRIEGLGRAALGLAGVGLAMALGLVAGIVPRDAGPAVTVDLATLASMLLLLAVLTRGLLRVLQAMRAAPDWALGVVAAQGEQVLAVTDGQGRPVRTTHPAFAALSVERRSGLIAGLAAPSLDAPDGVAELTPATARGPDDLTGTVMLRRMGPDRLLWSLRPDAVPLWTVPLPLDATAPADPTEPALPQPDLSPDLARMTCAATGQVLGVSPRFAALWGGVPSDAADLSGELWPWAAAAAGGLARTFALQGPRGPLRAAVLAERAAAGGVTLTFLPLAWHDAEASAPDAAPRDDDVELIPIPLLRFDPTGQLVRANRAGREAVALAAHDHPPAHLIFDGLGRPVADWIADVAAVRLPTSTEILRLSHDPAQAERFFQITLRRAEEAGRITVLAVLQDATAFKSLEAQFVQSQKMQAIGQLAGGIAHDFNNLLTAISGHCDLLMLRHRHEDPAYADLVQIHQNANRAAALVGQLLAFSRKQTLKPERLDLDEVLSDLTHLLNRLVGEKVRLRLHHAHGLGPIRADRRKLEQVVLNLVVNARDAMPEGGTILLRTEAMDLEADVFRDRVVVPRGRYGVIRVIDQGIGIPPDRLQKIFEPFFTTKRAGEGTGLGLSTAYGIVKQSGGFIFVQSTPGQGSQFEVIFPIHDAPAEAAPAPPPPPARSRPGEGVVLLVEDEAPVRAFAARALRLRGYTVLEADCGETALALLQDDSLTVDVFVSDVIMPGLDGPGWVAQALERRPDVPTVFMSGYAEEGLSETQQRIAHSVFLPKPFSLTDLTRTVQAVLGQPISGQFGLGQSGLAQSGSGQPPADSPAGHRPTADTWA